MSILSIIAGRLGSLAWKYLKDDSGYKSETKYDIDKAIDLYYRGDYNTSLQIMEAIARLIDCNGFHQYDTLQYKQTEAREQYNRLCLYIARIYSKRGNYSKVQEWASNIAYLREVNLTEWSEILTVSDYRELTESMELHDIDQETASGIIHDWSRRCD